MTFARTFFVTSIAIFLLALGFGAGYYTRAHTVSLEGYPILSQAHNLLTEHALKDLPAERTLEYGMIRGMLQAFDDPYTVFVEPAQAELQGNVLHGSFGGIGVSLGNDEAGNWVLFPFPESPAQVAGVQEGDRLLAVDQLEVAPDTPSEAIQSAIRGPVGDRVTLKLGRAPDYQPVEVRVARAEIPLPSVIFHIDPDEARLGILQVNIVAESTAHEIEKAVADMQSRGATHFVLDLRNNPGGLLDAGVKIARLFLKEGVVIEQQYRGQPVRSYDVEKVGPLSDLPLAVLINHGSASAAEIVAGALKAHGRAQLVGVPTYGKDSLQLVYELEDKSSIHITAAKWWVPDLEPPLGGVGVQPDVVVEESPDAEGPDPLLIAVRQVLLGSK